MGLSKQRAVIFLLALVATAIGRYFIRATRNGLCLADGTYYDTGCTTMYIDQLGRPIFFFSIALLVVSLLLFFVREEVYKSWRRFAYWAIPISIILLWIAPTSGPTGIGISYLNYTKESASWLVSGAFLLVSLWIIVSRSLRPASK